MCSLVGCGGVGEKADPDPDGMAAMTAPANRSDEHDPRGCPSPNWPGPWTACDEADWVRAVVRRAGYATSADTGSALVASTGETGFYIWTTAGSAEAVSDRARLGTVAGTPVFGDERVWRFWSAHGFIFWTTAGPSQADTPLSFATLAPLVEASRSIAPPA